MRLAAVQHVFRAATDLEKFEKAKAAGLAGIEPDLSAADLADATGARLKSLRAARDATGLSVHAVCMGFHNNEGIVFATWRGTTPVEEVRKALSWCRELGATALLVPFFGFNEPRNRAQRKVAADGLKAVVGDAEKLGVALAFESALPPAEFYEIASEVNSPAFGVYYDCGNVAWMERHPADELLMLAPYVKRVHLKDTRIHPGDARLGTGGADLPAVAKALKAIGYDGWLTVEAFGLSEEALAADLATARKVFAV